MTLNSVPHGLRARVLTVIDSGAGSLRLTELGLVPGASISVVRSAPLGDPIQVKIRDYYLALRRADAELIQVAVEREI